MGQLSSNSTSSSGLESTLRGFIGSQESADLELDAAFEFDYPHSGEVAYLGLFTDKNTGFRHKYFFDGAGNATDAPTMQRRDQQAKRGRYGRLGEKLHQSWSVAAPNTVFDVSLSYSVPAQLKPAAMWNEAATRQDMAAARAAHRLGRETAGAHPRAAALAELTARGITVTKAPAAYPIIYAKATRAQLAAFADPGYTGTIAAVSTAIDESAYQLADFFYGSDDHESKETFVDNGNKGAGIEVGIVENVGGCGIWYKNDGGNVQPTPFGDWAGFTQEGTSAINGCNLPSVSDGDPCPQVPQPACNNASGFCRNGACVALHPTITASHIGAKYTGCTPPCNGGGSDRVASKAHIFFANDNLHMTGRMSWLDQNAVKVFNHSESWGNTNAFNYAVRNYYMTMTQASGNSISQFGPIVHCYANSLCVGAARPANTTSAIDSWKSDPTDGTNDNYAVVPGWVYGNGLQGQALGDVEKPDVVAIDNTPGVDADTGTWTNFGGTSFAAPKVAGMVAQLVSYQSFTGAWPELVRPLIMTAAVSHNVEGEQLSVNGGGGSSCLSGGDECDGAGMPTMDVLKKIMDRTDYAKGSWSPSDFPSGWYLAKSLTLPDGDGIRVVLGWMHCVPDNNDNSNDEFIAADFDLYLYEAGTQLTSSASANNSLEMVSYKNTTGNQQTVEIWVRQFGTWQTCRGSQQEYWGMAWARHTNYIVY